MLLPCCLCVFVCLPRSTGQLCCCELRGRHARIALLFLLSLIPTRPPAADPLQVPGLVVVNGILCQNWSYTYVVGQKTNYYNMYVTADTNQWPVLMHMLG